MTMTPVRLEDNVVNRRLTRDEPKFKIWSSAGLMLTYRCPSRCACCYVHASPEAGAPETEMRVELALAGWRDIRRLAGPRGKVHITGGEPFGDYPRLKEILQGACEQNLEGLEKIETNAFWCTDDAAVRERLGALRELGLRKLQISTDLYHQEFIPIERVERGVRIGREVLGEEGVQIRWRDFFEHPVVVTGLTSEQRRAAFRDALAQRPERLTGRAAEELAPLLPQSHYEAFGNDHCARTILGARHVHIDGAGHVFSGTCHGIILGKIDTTAHRSLEVLWRTFDYRRHPMVSVLIEQGPVGLLEQARAWGYRALEGYGSKCHLCYDIRRFLFQRGYSPEVLGPSLCYGGAARTNHPRKDR